MKISKSIFNLFPRRVRHLFNIEVRSEIAGKPLIVPLRSGARLDALWSRSWKTEVIKSLCRAKDGGAFIDIGANLGQTLMDHIAADVKVPYIGFEPNPVCIYWITELIRINALAQYTILPVGLSNEAKLLPFYRRADVPEDDSATLIADLRPTWNLITTYIPCFKFDDIRQSLNLEHINLIKIDVEGAELEVLKGMQSTLESLRPAILCEVLFTDPDAELESNKTKNAELMRLLGGFDYRVFQLVKSEDDKKVVKVNNIEAFETAYFSRPGNSDLCDYLFIPAEKERQVVNLILPAHH